MKKPHAYIEFKTQNYRISAGHEAMVSPESEHVILDIYIYVHIYTCVCVCMNICVRVCICTDFCVLCVCIYIYIYIHTCVYVFMYSCMYTHILSVCTCVFTHEVFSFHQQTHGVHAHTFPCLHIYQQFDLSPQMCLTWSQNGRDTCFNSAPHPYSKFAMCLYDVKLFVKHKGQKIKNTKLIIKRFSTVRLLEVTSLSSLAYLEVLAHVRVVFSVESAFMSLLEAVWVRRGRTNRKLIDLYVRNNVFWGKKPC